MAQRPLIAYALAAVAFAAGQPTPAFAQVRAETIVNGLQTPVAIVADPTDRARLFVVEQHGVVRVVRDGGVLSEPFLDLRAQISAGGERGLLGLALAPDFVESRRFFVNFTDRNGDTVVARFLRSAENPLVADPASRLDLIWPNGRRVIDQPFSNHNGGHLAFGPDGYLYVGMGDGGSGGDPMHRAQDPESLLGKMLRIDVSVPDEDPRGYRVPEDNPFVDGDPVRALPEIWAFGLRNPWRYSFDDWTRGGTSILTIGDVGQNAREEINVEPRATGGRNYGWRLREGRQAYDARRPAAYLPLVEPVHDYGRSIGASVTGGLIYRGSALDPAINGRYFYADFVTGRVFSLGLHLDPITGEASADDEQEYTERLGGRPALGMVSSFGVDHDGELLLLNYSTGSVLRVVPDFSVVPAAPFLTASGSETLVDLSWEPSAGGVAVHGYVIERIRLGTVVERVALDRTTAVMEWMPGDCVRIRAIARTGESGPPSPAVCAPTQPG
jgi:glucose/arabinose dehydrogenase